jgi:membrane-bound lytic murein transglycosylase D
MRSLAGLLVAALCLLPVSEARAADKTPAAKQPAKAGKAPARSPQKGSKPPARAHKGGKGPGKPERPARAGASAASDAKGGRVGPDESIRRSIAGGPTSDDTQRPAESPELRALREAEREIFAPAAPRPGNPWPSDTTHPLPIDPDRPVVHASGLPPQQNPREPVQGLIQKERDIAWIQALKMPDMPVRWDERVVRYLQFFRDDPRGRSLVAYGWKRAGRYGDIIRATLRAEKLPESLLWVSMVESGFDPTIKSHAGAAGLWQFMPDGARIYGLRVDRWIDERLDPQLSTQAGARYLSDLHRRFGGWELALAAYNMGYGGLLSAVRKYNTNDFWELSRFEAGIPWETTLYVPKIIAMAVVAENPSVFGLVGIEPEQPIAFDTVRAGSGTSLDAVARATGTTTAELEALNPQLRARRTPPDALPGSSSPAVVSVASVGSAAASPSPSVASFASPVSAGGPGSQAATASAEPAAFQVRVPAGKGGGATARLASLAAHEPRLARHTVRFGQTLESIAQDVGTSRGKLAALNGLSRDDYPHAGDVLLIPEGSTPSRLPSERPVVVAPRQPHSIEGKQRVFYRVIPGDTLAGIAQAFSVAADELLLWNAIDPGVRLQEATNLQIFVPPGADLSGVVALREEEAQVLVVGSDEFFAWFEAQKGRRRVSVTVAAADTWKTISTRYACSVGMLERINRRSRSETLRPGETLLVYTTKAGGDAPRDPREPRDEDAPGSPVIAPHPEDLPSVPAAPGEPKRGPEAEGAG